MLQAVRKKNARMVAWALVSLIAIVTEVRAAVRQCGGTVDVTARTRLRYGHEPLQEARLL